MLTPFHLAIGVQDLLAAKDFYHGLLGCSLGRRSDQWIDFNFFGHQLVCHQVSAEPPVDGHNEVDGETIPVPHFGVVLTLDAFDQLEERLRAAAVPFVVEPQVRFAGTSGEQRTFFVRDPAHNILEFKAFADIEGSLFKVE